MTRIEIKEEDIKFIEHDDNYIVLKFNNLIVPSEQLKQQILQDHEIVNRLNERIKVIETTITGEDRRLHPEIYKLCMSALDEFQKIRDGT